MFAEADDQQHEHEELFIYRVCLRFGFSEEEVKELDQHPEMVTFIIPKAG
jgi:hypothetical protein